MALQNSIYLLQTREFINTSIYKIGKTTKPLLKRFNQYPNGSRLILQMECLDCDNCEKKLLELFRSKYTNKLEYGREYFQGDSISMTRDIFDFIMDERELKATKVNVISIDKQVKVAKPKKIPVKPVKVIKEVKHVLDKAEETSVDIKKENNGYCCERCLRVFKCKITLIKHLQNKTECICIESLRPRDDILNDLTIREGITCSGCNKKYSNSYTLNRHQKSKNCNRDTEISILNNKVEQLHKILINITKTK
jgi:hypothetical protein